MTNVCIYTNLFLSFLYCFTDLFLYSQFSFSLILWLKNNACLSLIHSIYSCNFYGPDAEHKPENLETALQFFRKVS